ncbi:MAG: OmpA family protein [Hyphomicrobiaceae bacterium]|nr:OmpA family protein [Hyphomicrobiaceae bacterium]
MSQNVAKLKELLFDSEARALLDLQRRIEAVAKVGTDQRDALARDISGLADREAELRQEIKASLDSVFERAGTEDRFTRSVAEVLDRALKDAEVRRHDQLSAAVAPLVVRTIKTEIRNSQDDLVEALYPITGRMVQAYVTSALKDLTNKINRRLEQNPAMLRLKSLMTGRSMAELALADSQRLEVEEIYLIRRGSGELVARWPQAAGGNNRDQVMSGILTAINDFSAEAFSGDGSALRRIDLGSAQVYLRASQKLLVAAKCTGSAAPVVEQRLDDELITTLEQNREAWERVLDGGGGRQDLEPAVAGLAQRLGSGIAKTYEEIDAGSSAAGFNPLKWLLWLVALAVLGWLAYGAYRDHVTESVRAQAAQVIAASADMRGYPVQLAVAPFGTSLRLAGLAPSEAARLELITRVRAQLPGTEVADDLSVVASGPDTRPDIRGIRADLAGLKSEIAAGLEAEAVRRSLQRTRGRLGVAAGEVARLEGALDSPGDKVEAAAVRAILDTALTDLGAREAGTTRPGAPEAMRALLAEANRQIAEASRRLAALTPGRAPPRPDVQKEAQAAGPDQGGLAAAAEALAIKAERLATLATAALQAASVRPNPVPPRDELERFVRAHAIFFGNATDFREPTIAGDILDQVASLQRRANASLRIVGYTDETGGVQRNSPLSLARAEAVKAALVARGVPAASMITIGRDNAVEISRATGDGSPNRRVEFEIGFVGELAR